ncbi:MAG: thiolase C-terminal domain-containing protein [Promethearchaeota archaeon]
MVKKLLRKVAMIGAGMSKFGAWYPIKQNRDLWQDALISAVKSVDNGINMKDVDELFLGNFSADLFNHETHLAPLFAQIAGLNPKPATRFESACASSGLALRHGVISIASGLNDLVMIGGVETMTEVPTVDVTDALAAASDTRIEYPSGATFPGLYALVATAHMHKYGTKDEDLFNVAIKNYENGAENPFAHVQKTIKQEMERKKENAKKRGNPIPQWKTPYDFLRSKSNPYIAYPLRLFDCSLVTDGAACLFLASEDVAKKYTDTPIWITGVGQGSDTLSLQDRSSFTSFNATKFAAKTAYDMSGLEPKDIQIAEVHDCFTIAELVAMEDLGFYKPGEAAKAVKNGETKRDGKIPINTSGGLKTKGHPVGTTGAAQAVEIFKQMRGRAERNRQVKFDVKKALTHNLGGSGATCAVHIYEK